VTIAELNLLLPCKHQRIVTRWYDARAQANALPDRGHVRAMKTLKVFAAVVIGVPILVGIARVITRFIDPEGADALLMGAIMWTSMALCVLAPIGLAIYATFRLVKSLAGRKSP
jgi:hypothetical protein